MSASEDTSERSNIVDRKVNDGIYQAKKKANNLKSPNKLKPETVLTNNLKEDDNNDKSNTPTQSSNSLKKKQRSRRKNKSLIKSKPLLSYLKLSIRHLPPLLSETEFFNQVYKLHPELKDLITEHYYVTGEYNINPFIPGVSSRCYICMENEKNMMLIGSAIKNMEFKDCKLTEINGAADSDDTYEAKESDNEVFKPVVEKSIYDKMPNEKVVPGNQNATIINNPIYKLFVQYSEDKEKKDIPDSFFKLFASNKLKIEQEAKLAEKRKKKIAMKEKKTKKMKERKQKELKDNNSGIKKEKEMEKGNEKEEEDKVKSKKRRKKAKKKTKEGKPAPSGATPNTSTVLTTSTTSTTSKFTSKNKLTQKKNKKKPETSSNTQKTVAQGTSRPQPNPSTSSLKSAPSFPSASICVKKKVLIKRADN